MKIIYKVADGFASDLRYENDDYVLKPGEVKYGREVDTLPTLESLHDSVAMQARKEAEDAERLRLANLKDDALAQELLDRLRSATPAQIVNYVDAQVIDLASARTMFKRILNVMAARGSGT